MYLGIIPDKLKNQVHYKKTEGDPGQPINTEGLSEKQLKALGRSARESSYAFIGSKTVADMEKITKQSVGLNDVNVKGRAPALVVTPFGVVVYGTEPPGVYGSTNSYILYKSLK